MCHFGKSEAYYGPKGKFRYLRVQILSALEFPNEKYDDSETKLYSVIAVMNQPELPLESKCIAEFY